MSRPSASPRGNRHPNGAARPLLRLIGYTCSYTGEQASSLGAQSTAILAAAAIRPQWHIVGAVQEHASGNVVDRPLLAAQLERVRGREADGLIVARLDRLALSLAHLHALLENARVTGWVLVALDTAVDLSTPTGRTVAGGISAAAQFRRRVISERTREALAARRQQGVRLGRPRSCPDDVLDRVIAYRVAGTKYVDICAQLNADGVPTPAGSPRWHPSHLSRLLRTQDACRIMEEIRLDAATTGPINSA